jgi:hypothetical protein
MSNDSPKGKSIIEFLEDDLRSLPQEVRTFERDGKCWHPMSLRIGDRCIGCSTFQPYEAHKQDIPQPNSPEYHMRHSHNGFSCSETECIWKAF